MTTRSPTRPSLSIILPVYNETVRLVSGLSAIAAYLKKQSYDWELIIVDDGSDVPVTKMLKEARVRKIITFQKEKLPIRIYRLPRNMGKGAAIRFGVSKAQGDMILFSDIDLSVPIETTSLMRSHLAKYPMVIASRRRPGSLIVTHQSWSRETSGRIFTALSNIVCGSGVADVTCGFKGFTRKTAQKLFGRSRLNRWVFDSEIVFLARKYGVDIYEMPVVWTNKTGSKVRSVDSVRSLVDLFMIRWYELRGLYRD